MINNDKIFNLMFCTNRLKLIAATLEHVCAELEAPENLACLLNAHVEPGWPPGEYDRNAQMFFRDRMKEGGSSVIGWYGWYAIRRENSYQPSELVGSGGYFGPPNEEGMVEIGFSIMPSFRNMGYATELVKFLIKNAFIDSRVQKVIAHTTPINLASQKVLEKCGFKYVSSNEESSKNLYEILRDVGA